LLPKTPKPLYIEIDSYIELENENKSKMCMQI